MFKNLFRRKIENEQLISVLEYPEIYCFETYYKIETGLWRRTDLVTISKKDVLEEELGTLVLKHLNLSKFVKEKKVDFDTMYDNYKKITSLSSIKKQMSNSKSVQVSCKNNEITFTPSINGGTKGDRKGYRSLPEKEILTLEKDNSKLGKILLEAFKESE